MIPGKEPVPGYRLIAPLGQGGFGAVWSAEAPGGFLVALKFVRLGTAHAAPELRALDVIRKIRHPHLLSIHFAVQQDEHLIIATELCDQSLLDRLQECQKAGAAAIPLDELLPYMEESAKAIDFLNESRHLGPDGQRIGVQHRDIKPANIFLVGGSVKVADFGLAKILERSLATNTGSMTPLYAAPEVFKNQISGRTDQYSLAVTYFHCRTGSPPFAGSAHEIMYKVLYEAPDLSALPEPERAIIARAMAKDPAERWESCNRLVQALAAGTRAGSKASAGPDGAPGSEAWADPAGQQPWGHQAPGTTNDARPGHTGFDSGAPQPGTLGGRAGISTHPPHDTSSGPGNSNAGAEIGAQRPADAERRSWRGRSPASAERRALRYRRRERRRRWIAAGTALAAVAILAGIVAYLGLREEVERTAPKPAPIVASIAPIPPAKDRALAKDHESRPPNAGPLKPKAESSPVPAPKVEQSQPGASDQPERTKDSSSLPATEKSPFSKSDPAPAPIARSLPAPAPIPKPQPAIYTVTVVPSGATLATAGTLAQIERRGGDYVVTIADPDPDRPVTLLASHAGYQNLERTLRPAAGETAKYTLRLAPLPAEYTITVDPPETILSLEGGSGAITGSGNLRKLRVPEPDGSTELMLRATLEGHKTRSEALTPSPGATADMTLRLEPEPAVFEISLQPATAALSCEAPGVQIERQSGGTSLLTVERPKSNVEFKLTATAPGHKGIARILRARPGRREQITIALEPDNPKPAPLAAPFSADQARAGQQAWARYLKTEVVSTNTLGMKLVLIPPGEFEMGSRESAEELAKAYEGANAASFADEYPLHKVKLTKPFLLGQHEVTVGQFRAFVEATGYKTDGEKDGKGGWGYDANDTSSFPFNKKPEYGWQNPGFSQSEDHPVVNVSWNDAVAFCKWLSEKEGKNYRLATEAEWEYSCRAGTTGRYYHGDDSEGLAGVGNVFDASGKGKLPKVSWPSIAADDGYAFTAPVGKYRANGFGLYDMHGNVWEWCADWYDESYYRRGAMTDPRGPSNGKSRVLRGGAWLNVPRITRSADRNGNSPDNRISSIGFRLARTYP